MLQLHENTQLQELILNIQSNSISQIDLRYNRIGVEGAKALAQALKENHSILQIELGENQIGVEGAKAFAEALIENHSITYIDLSANGIGDGGAKALARALKENHSITKINLGKNRITDEGAEALAEALKENHHISRIALYHNQIGDKGAEALAQAFKENYSISQITLTGNQIGDKGAEALAQALEKNHSIITIDLEENNKIGVEGAEALEKTLEKNHIITEINFDTYQIGVVRVEALAKALEKNKVFLNFAIGKLSQEKVVLSDIEMYTLKAHIEPTDPNISYKDQYDKYLELIIPKMEYLFHNQDKIAKRAVSIPLIANEIQEFLYREDLVSLNTAIYDAMNEKKAVYIPLITNEMQQSLNYEGLASPNTVANQDNTLNEITKLLTNTPKSHNSYNFIIGSFTAYALNPAIKCLTDIVSGKNLDQKLSDYYQVAISANSLFSFFFKAAVSNLIYQASSQNNFGIVNSMIASKLVYDVIDTSYNLITGNKINDNVTISEYSTETLAYIAKMSAANVMNYAFLSHYGACDIYSSTLVNMALPLGELGLAIVYKSGEILDHLLNPNGNHIDFDYYL